MCSARLSRDRRLEPRPPCVSSSRDQVAARTGSPWRDLRQRLRPTAGLVEAGDPCWDSVGEAHLHWSGRIVGAWGTPDCDHAHAAWDRRGPMPDSNHPRGGLSWKQGREEIGVPARLSHLTRSRCQASGRGWGAQERDGGHYRDDTATLWCGLLRRPCPPAGCCRAAGVAYVDVELGASRPPMRRRHGRTLTVTVRVRAADDMAG
jgi:hypothetical protein